MATSKKDRDRIMAIFSGTCSEKKVCPVKDIMASYGDKWSMYTILFLGMHQTVRFSQLRGGIHGISQRMLTVTLRSLQEDGIINRTIFPKIPPHVEYSLTTLGESLLKKIVPLASWAEENVSEVLKARKKYRVS